jgi:hypothetical protein
MRNWLFRETRNFAKRPVSFAKQQNSFRIEFRETRSETSFAGNPTHRQQNTPSHFLYLKSRQNLTVVTTHCIRPRFTLQVQIKIINKLFSIIR